jgi:CTP:molybdopterin cytidylyltransferase MocA
MKGQIVPIILAAGGSTRADQPKALYEFDGKRCIELAIGRSLQAGLKPIVVLGSDADSIIQGSDLSSSTVLINYDLSTGQISSLKLGLANLPRDSVAFLIYPVDFPLIREADINLLVSAFRGKKGTQKIFLLSYRGRCGHPNLLDISIKDELMELGDGEPARRVIFARSERIVYVESDNPYILMNMNTHREYLSCLQIYRSDSWANNRI